MTGDVAAVTVVVYGFEGIAFGRKSNWTVTVVSFNVGACGGVISPLGMAGDVRPRPTAYTTTTSPAFAGDSEETRLPSACVTTPPQGMVYGFPAQVVRMWRLLITFSHENALLAIPFSVMTIVSLMTGVKTPGPVTPISNGT